MNGSWWLAGLTAGIAIFVWGFVSHMLLGLGETGVKALPNETAVLGAMAENVKAPGLYIFPYEQDPNKWAEAAKKNPTGILVFTPAGKEFNFGKLLAVEGASNVLQGLLSTFLFVVALPSLGSFTKRVLFVATLGAIASVAIDISYWNWYGFPLSYTLADLLDQTLGSAAAGIVLALFARKA